MTTRRELLVLGASTAALTVCPLAGACGGTAEEGGGPVEVGNVDDFEEGLTVVDGKGVIVGRDADGLYAMTAICTHNACDMSAGKSEKVDDELKCTCHGSQYDANGDVTNGPAPDPLEHYKVEVDGDKVTVIVGEVVDKDERVEV
jgi:cytochrome b6-f complex iron-sulfur subunit